MKVAFTKDCQCKGTATTGRTILTNERREHSIFVKAAYHPGPVCDVCNKPWGSQH